MNIRNPIEPMTIEPSGKHGYAIASSALAVAILTSIGWGWLLTEERALHALELAEVQARQPRVAHMTLKYSNGARQQLTIREEQP